VFPLGLDGRSPNPVPLTQTRRDVGASVRGTPVAETSSIFFNEELLKIEGEAPASTYSLEYKPMSESLHCTANSVPREFGTEFTFAGSTLTVLPAMGLDTAHRLWVRYAVRQATAQQPTDEFSDFLVHLAPEDWTLNGVGGIEQWNDSSGNNYHYTAPLINAPAPQGGVDGTPSGLQVAYFTNPAHMTPDADWTLEVPAGAEIFWVLKSQDNTTGGLHTMRPETLDHPYVPAGITNIQDGWGSDENHTFVTPSMLSAFRVYHVISESGHWEARIDGSTEHTDGSNNVAWADYSLPVIGISNLAGGWPSTYYAGRIAEVIVTRGIITEDQRTIITNDLISRHGL
jgi:hypothetical protein